MLTLARAVRLLIDRGLPVHLLCPGKGADRTALVALLGSRVSCPGVLEPETLARAYASADIAAQPAIVEELSNAVLESSSSGLPLLVAASSGSGRFVVEGETGLIVPDSEPASWARALQSLLDEPRAPARHGPRGARLVAAKRPDLARGAGRRPAAGLAPARLFARARRRAARG